MRFVNQAIWAIGVGAVASASLLAQTTSSAHTAAAHKKTTHKQVATKPAATTQVAHRTTATTSKKSAKTPVTLVHRSTQQQPTTDRYREIQMALSQKGYFAGEADGNWSTDSVTALKRFQHDQNLTDDGKLGSLSLIALGLGPHRPPAIAAPSIEAAPAPEKSAEKSAAGPAQTH